MKTAAFWKIVRCSLGDIDVSALHVYVCMLPVRLGSSLGGYGRF